MYRRDSGEILIQRASFSFFFKQNWSVWITLSLLCCTLRMTSFTGSSTENIQETAIPHTQGLISCPVLLGWLKPLPGCLALPSQLAAGPALQQLLKINIRTERWQGTWWQRGELDQTNPSESPPLRPSKGKEEVPVLSQNPFVWPNTRNSGRLCELCGPQCKEGTGFTVGCLDRILGLNKSI